MFVTYFLYHFQNSIFAAPQPAEGDVALSLRIIDRGGSE